MDIVFDTAKRDLALAHRGLDFADAAQVFNGRCFTTEDDRQDYLELRYIAFGLLHGRMLVVVWTPRDNARRIISMRKANEREQDLYGWRLD